MSNALSTLLGGAPFSLGVDVPSPSPPTNVLLDAIYKRPRSRTDWKDRFSHWQRPASETEEVKIEAAARRIALALRRSTFLPQRRWRVIKQGSYYNNTNVRTDSDMDLCVCLTDAFYTDGPSYDLPTMQELGYEPLPFTFEQYKMHLTWCLEEEFGRGAVRAGKKAIHVNKDTLEKIQVDVVPAFVYQLYGARSEPLAQRGAPHSGIALITTGGNRITNFPEQHYANGCAKNDRTGRRYKRVVRILKRLRNHISDNPYLSAETARRAKEVASFLIESLVYSCPDGLFGHPEIYDDVVAVLDHLKIMLNDPADGKTLLTMPVWALWTEVNGIKPLFIQQQAWNLSDVIAFVEFARAYMDV
jgi:hypothetical protein